MSDGTRDLAYAGLAAAVVVASLTAMVLTVRAAERSTFVLVLEVATWVAATVAVASIPWRRTRWGGRTARGDAEDEGDPADGHG